MTIIQKLINKGNTLSIKLLALLIFLIACESNMEDPKP